jgi:hypothetical protein
VGGHTVIELKFVTRKQAELVVNFLVKAQAMKADILNFTDQNAMSAEEFEEFAKDFTSSDLEAFDIFVEKQDIKITSYTHSMYQYEYDLLTKAGLDIELA